MSSQKGFSPIAAILGVVLIVLIGVGYYLLTKEETSIIESNVSPETTEHPATIPVKNGRSTKGSEFSSKAYGFKVFIPEGWFFDPSDPDDTKVSPYINFSLSNYDHSDLSNFDENYKLSSKIKPPITLTISVDTINTKTLEQIKEQMLNHTVLGGGEAPDVTFTKAEETTFANQDALVLYSNLGKSVLLLNDKNYLYTISDITDPNPKIEDPQIQELSRKIISSFKLLN